MAGVSIAGGRPGLGPGLGEALVAWLAALARPWRPATSAALARPRARAGPSARGPDRQDLEAFEAVALPHLAAAYSFARFLTRGDAAAEDLAQEAYLRALRAFAGYRGGDARAWILTIVRRCFIDWTRSRRSGPAPAEEDAADQAPDPAEGAEAGLIRRQQGATVRRLIEDLPAPLAEVILLREVEELSYRQIAEAIDAPIGTVMSRLARARATLAAAWRALPEAAA